MPFITNNLYDYYRLYHHMTRACNRDPLLCLYFFFWPLLPFYCVLLSHVLFWIFLACSKKETNVLSLLTIFKNCLWFTLGNIFTSFSVVYTRCTYAVFFRHIFFVLSKYASKWNAPAIAIYQQFYNVTNLSLDIFSDFKDICCVCYSNSSAKICCILMHFVPVFLSLPMNFHKIPYQTHKSPQFSKYLHCLMNLFCVNHYIS